MVKSVINLINQIIKLSLTYDKKINWVILVSIIILFFIFYLCLTNIVILTILIKFSS